jgi:hypothetical protein
MKATPAFVTVCVLLGVSGLLNLVLLTRSPEAAPRSGVPAAAAPARAAQEEEPADPPPVTAQELAVEAGDGPALVPPPAARGPSASGSKPARPSKVKADPTVAAVIEAQEEFGAYWKEMDQLFKAKSRLEEARFLQAALGATMDFLELSEAGRARFAQSTQSGILALQQARAEHEAARKTLPPKDKSNPALAAQHDQQKNAIDDRYKAQVKAAVDGLKAALDPARPRHVEFGSNAERWLRNVVPKAP